MFLKTFGNRALGAAARGKKLLYLDCYCTDGVFKSFFSSSKYKMRKVEMFAVPSRVLMDEHTELQIKGLNSGDAVTVKSYLEERGSRFGAYAHFVADSHGEVNTATSPSLGGMYTGTDAMGLHWSMKPEPGQRDGLRLVKKDVCLPFNVTLSLYKGHINPYDPKNSIKCQVPVTETSIERLYKADTVERIPVREGVLRGALFVPKGPGPYPGVIDLFGTAGGLLDHRAALLASRGFVVLALAYFAYEDLTNHLDDLTLEYFEEGVEWLSHHPSVVPGGIGVIGTSKGAEIAMLMGIHFPMVKAVVNVSGPTYLSYSELKFRDKTITPVFRDLTKVIDSEYGVIIRECYPDFIPETAFLKAEQVKALLLFFGAEDTSFDVDQSATALAERLKKHGHKDYEIHIYEGAGHLIEPPFAPHCKGSYHKLLGTMMAFGGETQTHIKAEVNHWKRTQDFFRKHLSSPVCSKL